MLWDQLTSSKRSKVLSLPLRKNLTRSLFLELFTCQVLLWLELPQIILLHLFSRSPSRSCSLVLLSDKTFFFSQLIQEDETPHKPRTHYGVFKIANEGN